MAGLGGNPHQAALNLLREEWRSLRDIHRAILDDERLRLSEPVAWQRDAAQARSDLDSLGRTIMLLERHDGAAGATGTPVMGGWAQVPEPAGEVRRRPVPEVAA